jgi:hypothetical protein
LCTGGKTTGKSLRGGPSTRQPRWRQIVSRRSLDSVAFTRDDRQGSGRRLGRWHTTHRDPSAARSLRQDDTEKRGRSCKSLREGPQKTLATLAWRLGSLARDDRQRSDRRAGRWHTTHRDPSAARSLRQDDTGRGGGDGAVVAPHLATTVTALRRAWRAGVHAREPEGPRGGMARRSLCFLSATGVPSCARSPESSMRAT